MASRILSSAALRPFALARPSTTASSTLARSFQTSARRANEAATASTVLPARRPIGAFRGGLFGFLLGSSAAAYGTYYYILEEYRVSNELLTEDIYALQAAVQRIHSYVGALEDKVDALGKKSK